MTYFDIQWPWISLFSTFSVSLNFKSCLSYIWIQLQSLILIRPKMRELWLIFQKSRNSPREVPWAGRVIQIYIYYISSTPASIQYNEFFLGNSILRKTTLLESSCFFYPTDKYNDQTVRFINPKTWHNICLS